MISAINIALSGLESATQRLSASAANIANLQTAGSLESGGQTLLNTSPYTPVTMVQQTTENGGVATYVVPKNDPYVPTYSPDSPFANSEGIIGVPNVDLAEEAVNMMIAKTTYKANIASIKTANDMSNELFRILDEKA